MRLFYVPSVKKYLLYPAFFTLIITFFIQFLPAFFMNELAFFAKLKAKLGYPITFFPDNTLLPLRLLFSIFYAFIAGFIGYCYFRLKFRNSGHTILFSNGFKGVIGILFILTSYALLRSERFILNLPQIPKFTINSDFSRFLAINLNPNYFKPKIKIDPIKPSSNNTPYTNPPSQSNNFIPQNLIKPPSSQNNSFLPDTTQPGTPNIQPISRPATPQELFSQLNSYRARNGRAALIWDSNLGNYAQKRANLFAALGKTDNHAGFLADTSNGINYDFGFYGLSENAGYGVTGSAKYIIEDWFGTSPAHNNAQLNSKWTHVGIGVNGKAFDFIFGGGKTDSFHLE